MLIQIASAALVIVYFNNVAVQNWTVSIGQAKARGGLLFAFVAALIACGVIPDVAKALTGKLKRIDKTQLGKMAWAGLVYGIIGIQVDLLYNGLGVIFGSGNDPKTVLTKLLIDMTLFSMFISIPTATSLLAWYREGFRPEFWKKVFTVKFYRQEILANMPLCWAYWIPVLCCVYALPTNLQFTFAMLTESAWSLLFVFLVTEKKDADLIVV